MKEGKKPTEKQTGGKRPINVYPDRKTPTYSGFIIIRLSAQLALVESDDLRKLAKGKLPDLAVFLDQHQGIPTERLIHSVAPEELLKMEKKVATSEFRPLHSLTSYWRLDCRGLKASAKELVRTLQGLPEVDLAYRERAVFNPLVDDSNDTYAERQSYLDPACVGIDARWAWTQANGDGAGVGFVDLEQGWFLNHEDLIAKAPTLIRNDIQDGESDHGTAVLAAVVGADNGVGVVGVAPGVSSVRVVSHYRIKPFPSSLHVADAIAAATAVMAPGDVLLLEVERDVLPTETDEVDFNAIRLAVASGIIVVEAAGNGNTNLDTWPPDGVAILDRSDEFLFRDSGAIMVGSCRSQPPHNRLVRSNYGSRIDCFAWGENITTAGYGNLNGSACDPNVTYTSIFGGTSGASAIIAGAALIVQGMFQATQPGGGRLSPSRMRQLLGDADTGTEQGREQAGDIGVMPNLRAIIEETLGLTPDLYLRDHVGDTGVIPSTGSISASPDIIVRPFQVPDPTAAFGEGSGNENSNLLGSKVESGQDNYIYVRMRNRGSVNADNAVATVYWSEVSTLVTPDMWHHIGTTPEIDVPAGDTLVVTDPITWPEAKIPAPGHYCLVGMLNQDRDLAPLVPAPTADWDDFCAFIRNNNNVTWCNFNVIDEVADPSVQEFRVAGAPDQARMFDLEILQRLPEQANVILEMPMALFVSLQPNTFLKVEIDRKKHLARVSLPHLRCLSFRNVRLSKGARYPCRLILTGLGKKSCGHSVAIRQIFEEQEVGRITWVFQQKGSGSK